MKFSSLAAMVMVLALVATSCSKESILPEEASSSQDVSPQLSVQGCWVSGANQTILAWYSDMAGAMDNCYPENPEPCAILGNVTTTKTLSGYNYTNTVEDKNFINTLLNAMRDRAESNKPVPHSSDPMGTAWIIQNIDLNMSVSGGNPLQVSFTLVVTYRRVTCPAEEVPFLF